MSHSPASAPRPWRRVSFVLVLLVLAAALAWWLWPAAEVPARKGPGGPGGRPGFGGFGGPVPVRVAAVEAGRFEVFTNALGSVAAYNTVNVRSRVAGELMAIHFAEGQQVRAGELLAEIDPRPYQVALQQAEGTLRQNEALLKNARLDLARYQGLLKADSIARQTLDTQQALVEQYQGTLATNRAAVEDARLNLQYTRIVAPIDGRVGLRQLDAGNLVTANAETPLVVITQTRPASVVFTLPESMLGPVLARHRQGQPLLVQAWDRGERQLLGEGELVSIDNQIDASTGTLKFKARFANEDELLLPNQFVNVRLRVETLEQATLVPSAAVQYGARGTFAYVVDEQSKVSLRPLTLGPSNGPLSVVQDGLAVGERVVLEGTDRLRDGAQVEVVGAAGAERAPGQAQAPARQAD